MVKEYWNSVQTARHSLKDRICKVEKVSLSFLESMHFSHVWIRRLK